jgi:hypothetical protein
MNMICEQDARILSVKAGGTISFVAFVALFLSHSLNAIYSFQLSASENTTKIDVK